MLLTGSGMRCVFICIYGRIWDSPSKHFAIRHRFHFLVRQVCVKVVPQLRSTEEINAVCICSADLQNTQRQGPYVRRNVLWDMM